MSSRLHPHARVFSPRGRGRGRGGGGSGGGQGRWREAEPRPTHFLALPLHNHSTLRTRVHNFQYGLLNSSTTPITGLDSSIVIDPRRLHFTLGVMALGSSEGSKTVQEALDLLHTLRPSIAEILNGASIKVRLDTMDVFKSNNNAGLDANVLFLGPTFGVSEEDARLWNVCSLINQSFRSAGFVTETRPLKLHCTILNTSHRRPRNIPFSYSDILASDIGQNVLVPSPSVVAGTARTVNFGTYDVGRVELWEMGSHGPNNEYVSCGGIGF